MIDGVAMPADLQAFARVVPCSAAQLRVLCAMRWAHGAPVSVEAYDAISTALGYPNLRAVMVASIPPEFLPMPPPAAPPRPAASPERPRITPSATRPRTRYDAPPPPPPARPSARRSRSTTQRKPLG